MDREVVAEAPAARFVALLLLGPLPTVLVLAYFALGLWTSGALGVEFVVDAPLPTYSAALLVALVPPVAMILIAHRARVTFGPDVLVSTVIGVGAFLGAVVILTIGVALLRSLFP